jgi:DNA invertase Pin-like site-specific DNA recombinase
MRCRRRGLAVAAEYVIDGASAWKGERREQLAAALADARLGKYDVLLVWAPDRLDRRAVESTLGLLRRFHQARAGLVAAGAVDRDRRRAHRRATQRDLRVDGASGVGAP